MDSGRPIFRAMMSMQRFQNLLRFCRFENDAKRKVSLHVDKVTTILEAWEMLLENLGKCFMLGKDLKIDEKLLATHGGCNFQQYIQKKNGNYGIKIF